MQARGKSMTVEPISVISTALTSNPVASIAAATAIEASTVSFSNVLTAAVDSQTSRQSKARLSGKALRIEAGEDNSQILRPPPSLLQYNSTIDLYVQLETLLREKSMLIAIV